LLFDKSNGRKLGGLYKNFFSIALCQLFFFCDGIMTLSQGHTAGTAVRELVASGGVKRKEGKAWRANMMD